jgi:ABC-type glycerol-3-phosphate transport system substrate-binding protein
MFRDELRSSVFRPLNEVFDTSVASSTLVPGWDTLATVDGVLYGLPVSANQKSLVFYNPSALTSSSSHHQYNSPESMP